MEEIKREEAQREKNLILYLETKKEDQQVEEVIKELKNLENFHNMRENDCPEEELVSAEQLRDKRWFECAHKGMDVMEIINDIKYMLNEEPPSGIQEKIELFREKLDWMKSFLTL
jgi:hypothetical protein